MDYFKKISIVSGAIVVSGFLLLVAPIAYAMTPTLSLYATGSADNVQVNVNGDPNASVILNYTKIGAGLSIVAIGTTDSSGALSVVISTSQYGISSSAPVYVTTGGLGGPSSNQVAWPYTSGSSSNSLSLSQGAALLAVGQSTTITANTNSLYLANNSNPQIANIGINSSSDIITIAANSYGSTIATVCIIGNSSNCQSIYVMVQNPGAGTLTLSQNNVSIAPNQSVPITLSGGNNIYQIINNSNPSIVEASINGQVATLSTTATSGSSSIIICSTDNSACGIINATATTAITTAITFSNALPTLSVGQTSAVSVYGSSGSTFYVSSNSNPSVVQPNLSGTTLTLIGIANGSSSISVCSSVGNCGSLTATVNYTSSGGTIFLSQNTVSLLAGQNINITISGGSTPYSLSANASNVFESSLNGNTLTIIGVNNGSGSMNVCSSEGGCTSLTVNVGSSSSANQIILSQTNISLTQGQTGVTIYITGNGSYYLGNNTNPDVAEVSLNQSSAIVTALSAGSDSISICQNGGQCATLSVTVGSSTATTAYPAGCTSSLGFSSLTGQSCGSGLTIAPPTPITAPTTQPAYIFARYLGYTDQGADVLALQKYLAAQGFLTATPNGRYGPSTVAAVKKLQAAHNIKQTGNIGPLTLALLNHLESAVATSAAVVNTSQTQITQLQQELAELQTELATATGSASAASYPAGCTSSSGFSSSTGQSCSTSALVAGLILQESSLSLAPNQITTDTITSGTGSYYISSNSNNAVASASLVGNIVTVSPLEAGTSNILVCENGGSCTTLYVYVNSSTSTTLTPTLSQSNLSLAIGQATVVYITGGGTYEVSSNSNSNVALANVSQNNVTITAVGIGSDSISICQNGGGCSVITVNVTTTVASTSGPTLSQSSLSLSAGQTTYVYITGGTGSYYISTNSNSSIASANLSGSQIIISPSESGTSNVSICENNGACTTLYISVNASTSSLTLGQNTVSLNSGQQSTISISGAGSYYVSSNSNPSVASVSINQNSAVVTAEADGSDNLSICQATNECATLTVTVSN